MAITLGIVNAIADNKLIWDRESDKLNRNIHFTTGRFVQQRTNSGDFGSRRLRISRTLDNVLPESMMSSTISTSLPRMSSSEVFQDFNIARGGHSAAIAGSSHEIDFVGDMHFTAQVGHKHK